MRRGGVRSYLLGAAIAVPAALVLAQLILPRIAASRISSRLGRYGTVHSVHVSAWPAVKLLWGDADSATVTAGALSVSPGQTSKLLSEARKVDKLDVTASSVREGPLQLSDVSLHKRGSELSGAGQATLPDVKAALPEGFGVQLLDSEQGKIEVRASGGLFGIDASVDAVAEASEGKLVAHPRGLLLEGLKLTLFSDPRVYVQGVGASQVSGPGGESAYRLTMTASLR
jgi:hypothetical protein